MKTLLLLLTLTAAVCFGCSKEEDAMMLRTTTPAPIVQVDVPGKPVAAGESVDIKVYFQVNNGCGEFGSFDEETNGQTTTIKVYPHYQEGYCTQAITTRETTYTFKPESTGTYTLKFWSAEDQYITRTITVE